ncbi:MAG: prolyl oligopeptidase family serine peptidase [bacterium]|nr:prolyl oligopeptidase family serine peptidase [bacterium]
MKIPQTKKDNIIDSINGISISDPYRWLEDAKSSETKEWVESQNSYTDSFLRNENFEIFSNELVKNFKVVNFSNPIPVRGKYFYSERQPDEDQSALYVRTGINGNPVKLVDPNGMRDDNTINIAFWSVSRTGKYLAYGLSQGGDEMAIMYIKGVDTGINLSEQIPRCRHSQISWLPDDSGFFYTKNPEPGTVPKNEEHLHTKIYFHKIGDNPNNDELIFGKDRPKDDMLGITISMDGRYLAISSAVTWTENDIYIYDRDTKQTKPFVVGMPAKFSLKFLEDKVIVGTNYNANNFRILSVPIINLFTPTEDWEELIPERKYLLQSETTTKTKIIVTYLVDACSKVVMFDHSGKEIGEIPLPPYSSLAGISRNIEEDEFFYGVDSFTFPKITYRYSPIENKFEVYRKTDNPINPNDYVTKQEWYQSKDGTRVPLFIFHKKNISVDGVNPTILYGYGGFADLNTPGFMRGFVSWMERGGIYVIANIRGGGEFGEKWHKDGMKENKQNSFDDFIAAAEYLIQEKYTDRDHLGILGGSNGGLLVSAVAVQRPELFKAVCSRVPLIDMVRFPLFGIASRWVHEYGNPEVKEDLQRILKWSPYHNVKEGVEYPSFLFTTASKDTRVDPLHARKMTAMLQSVNKKNTVLIFTEMETGHGPGKPIKKIVESQTLLLTFFAQNLDLKI